MATEYVSRPPFVRLTFLPFTCHVFPASNIFFNVDNLRSRFWQASEPKEKHNKHKIAWTCCESLNPFDTNFRLRFSPLIMKATLGCAYVMDYYIFFGLL